MNRKTTQRALLALLLTGAYFAEGREGAGFFPYGKIERLERERLAVITSLSELPERNTKWMGERFGYHSVFSQPVEEGGALNEWVELRFSYESRVMAVALAPAVNPEGDRRKTYGFPRRFRIEFRMDRDGDPVYVIDRSGEDFPDPGLTPVIFSGFDFNARFMKIIVDRGEVQDGQEFFALSEVFVFNQTDEGLDNIAPYASRYPSHHFESYPYWEKRFLVDRISSFNIPLGTDRKENTDFIARFPLMEEEERIQVILDLGQPCRIGRAEFYPADPPSDILLPHFGYPMHIEIEVFEDEALQKRVFWKEVVPDYLLRTYSDTRFWRPITDQFFAVPFSEAAGRFVRLSATSLSSYNDQSIFALGEIALFLGDQNLSQGCVVKIDSDKNAINPLHPERLVDGYVNGLEIINVFDWLKGLERREQLERRLSVINMELTTLEQAVSTYWRYTVGGLVLLLLTAFLIIYIRLRMARMRAVREVREQISRDLHDDVGCSLGTLSLGIGNLRQDMEAAAFTAKCNQLGLVTKETSVALEEAIFFTQKTVISWPDLVLRLEKRAKIILEDGCVGFSVEGMLPDQPVDYLLKRHILLIFKEAMHNCSKHAGASRVTISVGFKGRKFTLCIDDNGKGFDPDSIKRGCGLNNMVKRAEKVGGTLSISTVDGSGTRLEFTLVM